MTLAKYIDMYIEQVKSGARQTEQGRNYAPSTIKSIVTALNQWKAFQQSVHKVYDFDDIDMKCYYDYTTLLKNKTKVVDGVQVFDGYSINSVGKCIKELKAILYTAEVEGSTKPRKNKTRNQGERHHLHRHKSEENRCKSGNSLLERVA